MTTVTYRDMTIASDSQVTESPNHVMTTAQKIIQLPHNWVYGYAGDLMDGLIVGEHLSHLLTEDPPGSIILCCMKGEVSERGNSEALLVHPVHGTYAVEIEEHSMNLTCLRLVGPYFAIGSGAKIALGAMHAGADAVQAVAAAIAHDVLSGHPIQVCEIVNGELLEAEEEMDT